MGSRIREAADLRFEDPAQRALGGCRIPGQSALVVSDRRTLTAAADPSADSYERRLEEQPAFDLGRFDQAPDQGLGLVGFGESPVDELFRCHHRLCWF